MQKIAPLERSLNWYITLGILFVPIISSNDNIQRRIALFLFGDLTEKLIEILHFDAIRPIDFGSDTIGLNVLFFLLIWPAILIAFVVKSPKIYVYLKFFMLLYLSWNMLNYGLSKIFLAQFPMPSSNILLRDFGLLDKDILYWSVIGISPFYQKTLGTIEVLAAIFLLIPKTFIFALFILEGILIYILIINFSFDISVKSFSLFLMLISSYLLFPILKFWVKKLADFSEKQMQINLKTQTILKTFFIGLVFIFLFWPRFNKSNETRNHPFHSAYKIINPNKNKWQKIHFHSNNYIIFEDLDGLNTDFYYHLDHYSIVIENYKGEKTNCNYHISNDSLFLNFNQEKITAIPIATNQLPATKNQFHWTIDQIK